MPSRTFRIIGAKNSVQPSSLVDTLKKRLINERDLESPEQRHKQSLKEKRLLTRLPKRDNAGQRCRARTHLGAR